jgi:hypothetical protein
MSKNVYKCIAEVQEKLSQIGIAKTKNNAQQGYKFRGIDDVYNALSNVLSDVGLVVITRCVEREQVERQTASGKALFYTTLKVEFDFVSSHDSSKHTAIAYGEAMDNADKSTNKAMSAAYKYAMFQTFCIPTEAQDADEVTHEVRPAVVPLTGEELAEIKAKVDSATSTEKLRELYRTLSRSAQTEVLPIFSKRIDAIESKKPDEEKQGE